MQPPREPTKLETTTSGRRIEIPATAGSSVIPSPRKLNSPNNSPKSGHADGQSVTANASPTPTASPCPTSSMEPSPAQSPPPCPASAQHTSTPTESPPRSPRPHNTSPNSSASPPPHRANEIPTHRLALSATRQCCKVRTEHMGPPRSPLPCSRDRLALQWLSRRS